MALAMLLGLALTLPVAAAPAQQQAGKQPLRVEQLETLRFGRVAAGTAPGRVTIDPGSGRKSIHGDVVELGGPHGRAVFRVQGEPDAVFAILLPHRVSARTGSRAGPALGVGDFRSHPARLGRLGPAGTATVHVGASLNLAPRQHGGNYRAAFLLEVRYP